MINGNKLNFIKSKIVKFKVNKWNLLIREYVSLYVEWLLANLLLIKKKIKVNNRVKTISLNLITEFFLNNNFEITILTKKKTEFCLVISAIINPK